MASQPHSRRDSDSPPPEEKAVGADASDAQRYRSLVEQAADGIFIADRDGTYLEVNEAGARLLAMPREKVIGCRIADLIAEGDRPLLADDWIALQKGETIRIEHRFRRGDGGTFCGEVSAKRLPDGSYLGIIRDITPRKQTEESLRQSEVRFRNLAAAAFEGICIHEHGKILDANEQYAQLVGRPVGELIGQNMWDIIAPESQALIRDITERQVETPVEHWLIRSDGTKVPVESQTRTAIADGRAVRIVAVRDISMRRRREAALHESEEKFAKVFRTSPIAIALSEFETGRIIDANDAFLETYHCTREQALGRTTLELRVWQDAMQRQLVMATLHQGGQVRDFKIKVQPAPGVTKTFLVSCELIELETRRCVLTMFHDITEQERIAAASRESEDKFSRAFRAGPHAMSITEFETGRYLDVNEGFERLFGHTRVETIGHTSAELHIWPSRDAREAVMNQLKTFGAVRDYEAEGVTRNGKRVVCLLNAELITLGSRRCVVMGVVDITDRKQAEVERVRGIEREMKVREEFTRRLIAAQEAERRRIAGELHDSLGQDLLLLKNRLRLALSAGPVPAEIERQLQAVEEMASRTIAEVRQISRDLNPYQLDQLGLTRAIEAMIAAATQSTGFPFSQRIEAVDDLFAGEAAIHVFRIVQECMSNILKHSSAKAARILLERDIHHVRFWAEDDGCGFNVETRGFGITNIEERVRILGGTIKLDSAPGSGTRVEVIIPIATKP